MSEATTFRSAVFSGYFGLPEAIAEDINIELVVNVRPGGVELVSANFISEGSDSEEVEKFLKASFVNVDDVRQHIADLLVSEPADLMWEFVEGLENLDDETIDPDEEYERLCVALGGEPADDMSDFEKLFPARYNM